MVDSRASERTRARVLCRIFNAGGELIWAIGETKLVAEAEAEAEVKVNGTKGGCRGNVLSVVAGDYAV